MKLQILLSAAVMMVSTVTASEPQLRGVSANSEELSFKDAPAVIFEGSDPFQEGLDDGRETAEDLWDDMGDNCANAFDFESAAKKEAKKKGYNQEGRNWQERAYNEGARSGMEEVVKEKEKECLHDSPEECIDLGEAASSIIANKFCKVNGSAYSQTNYKKECRDVAIDQCKGSMYNKVKKCGSVSTSTLNGLQNKCRSQVDKLLGINGFIVEQK